MDRSIDNLNNIFYVYCFVSWITRRIKRIYLMVQINNNRLKDKSLNVHYHFLQTLEFISVMKLLNNITHEFHQILFINIIPFYCFFTKNIRTLSIFMYLIVYKYVFLIDLYNINILQVQRFICEFPSKEILYCNVLFTWIANFKNL